MSKQNFIAVLDLDQKSRLELMALIPPKFSNRYLVHCTLAYNVGRHFKMPDVKTIGVVGYVETDRYQAFAVYVDGALRRADGKLYHITYTVDDGVPPAEAGTFTWADVQQFEGTMWLGVIQVLKPRTVMLPERLQQAMAA